MSLTGRSALVTGAGLRVGRAIALRLAQEGMDVALHYRSSAGPTEELAREIRAIGVRAATFQADLSRVGEAIGLASRVETGLGPLDLLVLSASSYPREPLPSIVPESFEATLRVNLLSPFFLAQKIGLSMKERGSGQIISLLDWSLDRPDPSHIPYQVSKAGLREATFGLARALAPEVQVNGIAPGAVLLPDGTSPERAEAVRKKTLVGHLGSPEDVARAVVYLAGAEHFVTGTVLRVDGGRSLL